MRERIVEQVDQLELGVGPARGRLRHPVRDLLAPAAVTDTGENDSDLEHRQPSSDTRLLLRCARRVTPSDRYDDAPRRNVRRGACLTFATAVSSDRYD